MPDSFLACTMCSSWQDQGRRHVEHGMQAGWKEPTPGQLRWERFLCGLAAGTLAKMGTHPLDVCKKRFQVGCSVTVTPSLCCGCCRLAVPLATCLGP